MFCLLSRSLYGLRQAPRHERFVSHVTSLDFRQSKADSSLFIYHRNGEMTYLPPLLCRRHDPVRFVDSTVDLDNTSSPNSEGHGTRSSLHRPVPSSPVPSPNVPGFATSSTRLLCEVSLATIAICDNISSVYIHGLKSSATPTKTSTSSLTFISFGRRSSLVSRPTCSPKAYRRHCPMISGTV